MKKLIICFVLALSACSSGRKEFVSITELDPSIILEMRYFTDYNFVGEHIHGYNKPLCLLTTPAAKALVEVQNELKSQGLTLRVYDCYRPQRAVDHFVKWAKDLNDTKTKADFYPDVAKENLFSDGYIAVKSGHSRGSTIDLTIDKFNMGTLYDFFSPLSNTENPAVGEVALAKRHLLKAVMEKYGFVNYDKEWWHYTLKEEPFRERYFNFVIE